MTLRLLPAALLLAAAAACGDQPVAPGAAGDPATAGGTGSATQPTGELSLTTNAPAEMLAGDAAVIAGTGFSGTPADNVVILGGVPLVVTGATATALTVSIPITPFACEPAKPATLSVAVRGRTATREVLLRAARPQPLAAGQSAVFDGTQRCIELPTAGSRYVVSVVNAGRAVGSIAPFEVLGRTASSSTVSAAPLVAGALAQPGAGEWLGDRSARPVATTADADADVARRRAKLHHRILETNRTLRKKLGKPGRIGPSAAAAAGDVQPAMPAAAPGEAATTAAGPMAGLVSTGDTATLRIPDIDAANACGKYYQVRTRVVYSGARALILEDVAAPLAGRMDATFRSIGEEFDSVMWPLLTTNFGNPLAMDAKLDANGRIVMLFSPMVNENFPGIAGFVIGCDFYPRTQAASSNEGEVFYATVPTSLTGGLSATASPEGWRRTMRSTIIHEAKHVTAYAERLARGYDLEDAWLEEGTARHAEELYARALSGGAWKGNAGYAAIACEVRPATTACPDRPYVMYKHFSGLVDYLAANGTLSPLGQTSSSDYNYYASAWALVRWAADLAPSEAAFLQGLTRGPATGVSNLEAVAGRRWDAMIADWTMSLALDDYPGFSPGGAQRIASWNLRDVFAGMNRDFPASYPRAHPLAAHAATFGGFSVQRAALRAGSGSVIELTGSWAGPQLLELRLPGGGAPSSTLRLAVTRVE